MKKKRILIVEDEPVVQLHLRKVLGALGYAVTGVSATAAEAFERAAADLPDLVLMDIRLRGGQDGVETARELIRRHKVAVVFLTAYADEETVERTQQVGAVGYIVKPFSRAQVRAMLSTALAGHDTVRRFQAREQSLTGVLASIGDAVILANADREVNFVNPQAAAITGCDAAEVTGKRVQEVIRFGRPGDTSRFEQLLEQTLGGTGVSTFSDLAVVDDGGEERVVEGEIRILSGTDESDARLLVLLRNVMAGAARDVTAPTRKRRLELSKRARFHDMIGETMAMIEVYEQIQQLARVDWSVLVEGETGTGKELVAQAIHAMSDRQGGPFVAVNCAGLTDSLLASQLFGHRKGAFTGAIDNHRGVFTAADGGTLFLDEIGDVSMDVQKSLLRVLENKEVTALGESKPHKVDVRLITATQRSLADEVSKGDFRADLLYRVRVARVTLPALRDRRDDIPLLANWFIDKAGTAGGRSVERLSDEALDRLLRYDWPGNIRELKSAIEFAILASQGAVIEAANLPPEILQDANLDDLTDGDEKERIFLALERTGGNRTEAARQLGMSRATFYRRLRELGIKAEQ